MRRRRIALCVLLASTVVTSAFALAAGCSASNQPSPTGTAGTGGAGGSTNPGGMGGTTVPPTGGEGGEIIIIEDGGMDVNNDAMVNPCGTKCGDVELCDPDHTGLDDNCNGQVDEGCPCTAGAAHSCFKGDPSYQASDGCYPGSQKCTENGEWGPCIGGVHATDDQKCYLNDLVACHPISAVPFQDVNLKEGTGSFSGDALPGSEVWTVTCPPGISPCPAVGGVNPTDDFKPLQSGEYTVTYQKTISGGGTESCTYPLFVGAPGLRVELEWEHDLGGSGVDLDLHVHQPNNTGPWGISGVPTDCTWSNCVVDHYDPFFPDPSAPDWFSGAAPPDPVDWYLDPVFEKNTCYFSPRGQGLEWQTLGMGCHNPRLDLDNITCDPLNLDPESFDFCAPENVNIDYPPKNEWTRIGVHYYWNHDQPYDVHPRIKVFCDGALAAELGPGGFYDPETPITFSAADGAGIGADNRFWLVADVMFRDSECGTSKCVVQPLYSNEAAKLPVFVTDNIAVVQFGPGYPPPPMP